jgi:hypothetical protein
MVRFSTWAGLALSLGLSLTGPAPTWALEASDELVTIPEAPKVRPAVKKPPVKTARKASAKAVVKTVKKPAPALVIAAKAAPAPAAYPLPAEAVPIPPDAFTAATTPSPPIAAGAPAITAPAATAAIPATSPMQPVAHARNAGVTTCLGALDKASANAIDADHDAFSTWSTGAPNDHLFQSIALMRYDNKIAPRSASVLLVTPNAANACEGGSVQVVPSARSCADIQAQLMQGGKTLASLTGLPLIENVAGIRQILLPSPGNGCVMISVGLIAGADQGR